MSENLPKIPDKIYENRCKYCVHFCRDGENREYEPKDIFSYSIKHSCRILAIAKYCYQKRIENGTLFGDYEYIVYDDGECRSFTPHLSYPGICQSCEYHNCFTDGYCYIEKGSDYRIAFMANTHGDESYASNFYTCSKWKMKSHVKKYFLDDIVLGKVPPIIDIETFKLVEPQRLSETAKVWLDMQKKKLAEMEEEKKVKEEPPKERQLSLWDIEQKYQEGE